MTLDGIIIKCMDDNGCEELAVIVNGEYLMYNDKMVYAHCISTKDDRFLEFYVKAKDSVNGKFVIKNMLEILRARLLSTVLFGVTLKAETSLEGCKFVVNSELGFLILESNLYNVAHHLVANGKTRVQVRIGSTTSTPEDTAALIDVFKTNTFMTYLKLIYATGNNRFLNKLMKYNKFYAIQKAFIPVFVDFKDVYNPFSDASLGLESTMLYQTAMHKDRHLVFEDKLSCYLLTHEEICRSFGMKHFMRFTPDFCYSLFVGLLMPSLATFPSKLHKIYVCPKELSDTYGFKSKYTPEEYFQTIKSVKSSGEAQSRIDEKLQALVSYNEVNTLYSACAEAYTRLTSIGSPVLDDKAASSLPQIYEYACEASLLNTIGG